MCRYTYSYIIILYVYRYRRIYKYRCIFIPVSLPGCSGKRDPDEHKVKRELGQEHWSQRLMNRANQVETDGYYLDIADLFLFASFFKKVLLVSKRDQIYRKDAICRNIFPEPSPTFHIIFLPTISIQTTTYVTYPNFVLNTRIYPF